ncbi:hypothetical protein NF867_04640 [Solitalea sp. MAHUQ-68]|uniref:Uncharacterized protein n=1 Tax=Solitalea agri TaxID=2953739 RepID=A0A9X2JBN4_9SPHI|nr:hypothetical protein [Solitalea agri]MCO4292148.1 hypothetical protein [Solitalea agri]
MKNYLVKAAMAVFCYCLFMSTTSAQIAGATMTTAINAGTITGSFYQI